MESSDLTPPLPDDERLHAVFREVAPPLPDDGFSVRVLAALPAPRSSRTPIWRTVAILIGAAVGFVFAWQPIAAWASHPPDVESFRRSVAQLGASLTDPHLWLGVALALGSLLYAFMSSARNRLRE